MLRIAAAAPGAGKALCSADNYRLPFADLAFDATFCVRFLHHVPDPESRRRCIAEIARVTRSVLVCTYFESRSLKHLARMARAGLRRRPSLRFACRFGEIRADIDSAGFRVDRIVSPVPVLGENRILVCSRKPSA
jgi:ubiquinone/menaquinone biosynthesis C-methylase UbiE